MKRTIGPNPTLIRLDIGREIKRGQNESENDYLRRARRARRAARRYLGQLRLMPDYRHSHLSFAVRDALLMCEAIFCDLGTFGVEHIPRGHNARSPAIDYLNTGDTYGQTVLYIRGQFRIGNWGDYVERGSYD